MDAPFTRKEKVAIAFMIAWMVFWAAGMLVALYLFGGRVFAGEPEAALFLMAWLLAAGFGLRAAALRLWTLLVRAPRPRPREFDNHRWTDGYSDRQDP